MNLSDNQLQLVNVQQLSNQELSDQFVWPKYKTERDRIKAFSTKYSSMSCIQAFATEYNLDLKSSISEKVYKKDLKTGELVTVTGINGSYDHDVYYELNGSTVVSIDMRKEKKFLETIGWTLEDFMAKINSKDFKDKFVENNFKALVVSSYPTPRVSLSAGMSSDARDTFFAQIKNPTTAFNAKIIGKNRGGFIVDVMGVNAFLPGSLAAANKIVNFDEYIGKEVLVMIEDYMSEIKTFIVSHKKYLDFALPSLIAEHDWTTQHTGVVTGCNKYGVFVEFYGAITGLLHVLKMKEDSKQRFDARGFNPGDEVTCYVHDIQNNRLVLTDFEPGSEEDQLQIGMQQKGKVINISKIGAFVQLKTGEIGVIKAGAKKYNVGDKVYVEVTEITEDKKVFFKESEKAQ